MEVCGVMVWVEEASQGDVPGAMTDVSCELLLSMGRVSSNGSILGLVGKIGRPQHFTNRDFRMYEQFMHYCLGVELGLSNLTQCA